MTHRQSRRTQRALERALFGPEPAPARRSKPRVERAPCEAPPQKIGDCAFCENHTELAYPGDVWVCPHCGGAYVYGNTSPHEALVSVEVLLERARRKAVE